MGEVLFYQKKKSCLMKIFKNCFGKTFSTGNGLVKGKRRSCLSICSEEDRIGREVAKALIFSPSSPLLLTEKGWENWEWEPRPRVGSRAWPDNKM